VTSCDRGSALTEGSIQPKHLLEVRDVLSVETYLLSEVQKVYRSQGVEIGDKHIEVMVRQMLRKVRVMDPGDTDLLPWVHLWILQTLQMLTMLILLSLVVFLQQLVQSLWVLLKLLLKPIHSCQRLPSKKQLVSLQMQPFVVRKITFLVLKENVIIGKIIPAGTGMARYRNH
jgi:DNA-directed RNA polymerase subunit beta'